MRFALFATAALAMSASAVNAIGFVFTSPSSGSVQSDSENINIVWYINQADSTSLPSGTTTDTLATFVLEDLTNGAGTGQPIGNPIATASIGALTASGALPSVTAGTSYAIRVQVGNDYVFTPTFQITGDGDATAAGTGTAAVATGTSTASATKTSTSTSATATHTAASSGAGQLVAGAIVGPVLAAAAMLI